MRTISRIASYLRSLIRRRWLVEVSARRRRLVEVSVLVGPHEVDSLQASDPETLRSALRPIYAHLPARESAVLFVAVEEEALPFGIRSSRRTVSLPTLRSAMGYLTGRHTVIVPAEASHWAHRTSVGAGSGSSRAQD
jgi:hypothetical protein